MSDRPISPLGSVLAGLGSAGLEIYGSGWRSREALFGETGLDAAERPAPCSDGPPAGPSSAPLELTPNTLAKGCVGIGLSSPGIALPLPLGSLGSSFVVEPSATTSGSPLSNTVKSTSNTSATDGLGVGWPWQSVSLPSKWLSFVVKSSASTPDLPPPNAFESTSEVSTMGGMGVVLP
ncbi:hypothetical protein B0T25DRAFT_553789 [Lasiosphaeria hispida]|uniref:Uncharacterized protein n=1 Tax=Lasiosphaeria hispida TaxID=260671 RepID=A0AAJ0HCP5_9PEZI|nr:hypothetical protein B0T25DRAFT_553789 [Lasiosphaeria hispida]